jgi:hypothetical protein
MNWTRSRMAAVVLVGLAAGSLAGRAAANTAAFSFVMERRAVHGKGNGKLHALDAGELTLSGGVWVVSKNRGSTSTPTEVEIAVYRDGQEAEVCSVTVKPSTIFNEKRSSEKTCGRVETASYWLLVSKKNDDGWDIKGSGTLTTK